MRVIGVDACRGGWVAVTLTAGTGTAGTGTAGTGTACTMTAASADTVTAGTVTVAADLTGLFEGTPDAIGIDMPLGLLEAGWRDCDSRARRLLGPRRASVFAIPPRAVWECPDYPAANRLCRELTGSGFSVQAWGLREKLLEANACRDRLPRDRLPLFEIHPELAFAAMNGGPLADSKHTRAGQAARRALLSQAVALPPDVVPPRGCPLIDLLDAAAVAWSTLRVAAGTGAVVPDPPQRDPSGHEVAIRY